MNIRWLAVLPLLCHFVMQSVATVNAAPKTDARFAVRVWETDDGLPSNAVLSMVQARDGHLWLGTAKGLVRFDGIRFVLFDESNTPGLKDNIIATLFEDSSANLWIGTEGAGTVLMKDGRVTTFPELAISGKERRLLGACEDADGSVWLYHANGDLWRYRNGRLTPLLLAPDEGQPRFIIKETNGPIRIATSRRQYTAGVLSRSGSAAVPIVEDETLRLLELLVPSRRSGYWRLANGKVQKWATNHFEDLASNYLWSFGPSAACEDLDGNLVVGTQGAGVFIVSSTGRVTSLSTSNGLSHQLILSLVTDREGTIWVGTRGGLNRVKRQSFRQLENLPRVSVLSVTEDVATNLWIGFEEDGLAKLTNGVLQQLAPNGMFKAVLADREGSVWISRVRPSAADLIQFKNIFREGVGGGLISGEVHAIHQDRAGRMWFGTAAGLVRLETNQWKLLTTRDGLSSSNITALADAADGTLWIGTQRGGINRLRDGQFLALRQADGAPSDDIAALLVDGQEVLWAATPASGLGRWENGKWTRYTTREGLSSNRLSYLLEDREGNLWIGSSDGLLRIPKKALTDFANGLTTFIPCRAYGTDDGLPARGYTTGSQPAAWRGRDGTLWFPTVKGLAVLDPAQLRVNNNPPPVLIESAFIDDVAVNARESLVMRPPQEHLEIQYSSLNLSAPERARFRYRLEGYENEWTEAGTNRPASYRKLPAGNYTFHVIACNEDGMWNEAGSTLAVIVQPPFWKTWWFLTATALGVFGLIAGIVHYLSTQRLQRQVALLKQQEALERERARIARDIHDQVGASLTQVALLGELVETDKNLPDEISAHAQQISQTARETTRSLDEIVWTVNPSNDTLEGLINYICKHAQEYLAVAGLRYRLEVPEPLPAIPISPEVRHNVFLAAKEAVTNIVRHAKATSAWIRLQLLTDSFVLEIEDNGRGIADPNAPSVRNGLRNMRKRMEDIGGEFAIVRGAEGGALVRLTVPLSRPKVPA